MMTKIQELIKLKNSVNGAQQVRNLINSWTNIEIIDFINEIDFGEPIENQMLDKAIIRLISKEEIDFIEKWNHYRLFGYKYDHHTCSNFLKSLDLIKIINNKFQHVYINVENFNKNEIVNITKLIYYKDPNKQSINGISIHIRE